MAKKTASQLVAFAKSKLGTPYVYGMKGEVMTLAKYYSLQATYGKSLVWDSDRKKVGKVCCDCSGLISWCTGIVRNSQGYKDTATKCINISRRDEIVPGCALWKPGHIGIAISKDEYIAEDGSPYGCRKNKISNANFTKILWLKDIDYTTTPKKPTSIVNVTYAVRIEGRKVLPIVKNNEGYAGIRDGRAITDLAVKVSSGSVKYRVHVKGGSWLPYVTGCDFSFKDTNKYAGNGRPIDAIQIIVDGKNEMRYKVAAVGNSKYYSWQYDANTDNGLDGYAGVYGKKIDRIVMNVKLK